MDSHLPPSYNQTSHNQNGNTPPKLSNTSQNVKAIQDDRQGEVGGEPIGLLELPLRDQQILMVDSFLLQLQEDTMGSGGLKDRKMQSLPAPLQKLAAYLRAHWK